MNHATGLMSTAVTAQPTHRLQRNRAPAREGIEHPGRTPAEGVTNLRPEPLDVRPLLPLPVQNPALRLAPPPRHRPAADPFVIDRLDDIARHPPVDRLPLPRAPGVGQQRPDQGRPARRQRPPRRPDVERRDVPVADVLLVDRVERHLFQGERDLNGALGGHISVDLLCGRESLSVVK